MDQHDGRVDPVALRQPLPPEVETLLQRVATLLPEAAERARASIARTLAPVSASMWPEVAHGFSRLTNTGIPIEFSWSSRDQALRWTAEVAPPETPELQRLAIAASLAGLTIDWSQWATAQHAAPLKYGAWLAMRHGVNADAAKVYVELPDGLPAGWRSHHVLLRSEGLVWRMAGLANDWSVELYARAARLEANALDRIEAIAFGSAGGRLLGVIESLIGSAELPRPSGLSIACDAGGAIRSLTWFTFAKSVFRDDAATHAAIAGATESAWSRTLYAALASNPADGRRRHGMVGAGVDATGATWLQAGVRPG